MSFLARFLAYNRAASKTTDVLEYNTRNLYLEIVFAAVMGAIVTFHGAFAVRLGGSKELVALLTSVPALVSAVFSIPSARFLERRVDRSRWIFGSLFALRLGIALIALIPILLPSNAATWLVVWVIILSLPTILFTNGFQALLAELIPERKRALVFTRRQMIWSAGVVLTSAAAGVWLDRVAFPLNYQLMYIFGFVATLGSHYYLTRMIVPADARASLTASQIGRVHEKARMTGPIARLLFNTYIYNTGLSLAGPLFIVYYIERLGASDAWIGLNQAANFAGVILGNYMWERLLRRHSYTWGIRRATLFTWLFPVGVALVPDLTFILIIGFFVNLFHPGVELTSLNLMLKLSDPAHRTVHMSWYNTVINASLFISPLVGVWLAEQIGIPATMLLSGMFRVCGSLLFTFNPVQEPPREAGAVLVKAE